jgi:hypothetical protein
MKRILQGFILGVMATIAAYYGWRYWNYHRFKDVSVVFNVGKISVEKSLDGARVLDVSVKPDYREDVNYAYDKMYGADVRYVINGKVKEITFPVSKYKEQWIGTDSIQILKLDDTAKVLHTSKTPPLKQQQKP